MMDLKPEDWTSRAGPIPPGGLAPKWPIGKCRPFVVDLSSACREAMMSSRTDAPHQQALWMLITILPLQRTPSSPLSKLQRAQRVSKGPASFKGPSELSLQQVQQPSMGSVIFNGPNRTNHRPKSPKTDQFQANLMRG